MGKLLSELPDSDDTDADISAPADPQPAKELSILNNILQVDSKSPREYARLKYTLFAAMLFMVLTLPFTDRILNLAVPMTNSWLMLVGIKTIAFFVLLYLFTMVAK